MIISASTGSDCGWHFGDYAHYFLQFWKHLEEKEPKWEKNLKLLVELYYYAHFNSYLASYVLYNTLVIVALFKTPQNFIAYADSIRSGVPSPAFSLFAALVTMRPYEPFLPFMLEDISSCLEELQENKYLSNETKVRYSDLTQLVPNLCQNFMIQRYERASPFFSKENVQKARNYLIELLEKESVKNIRIFGLK